MKLLSVCALLVPVTVLAVACSSDPTAVVDVDSGTPDASPVKDSGSDANPATPTYPVGGTVTGLVGGGLVLQNNASDDLTIAKDGPFAFATKLKSGAAYAVTIKTQPTNQTCVAATATGSVAAPAVSMVAITCTTNTYTVGGTVAGLTGAGLVLQDNGGDDLTVAASGPFTFATKVKAGGAYAITVKTQPVDQTCVVTGGTGTVASGNVTSATVNCKANTYTVGGTISGLAGAGLTLQNNAGDDLAVNMNGTFAFATPLLNKAAYAVTIKTQPTNPSQTCVLASATGTINLANVTTVAITCTTNKYLVGGMVTGLKGAGLVLQDNAGDDLTVAADGKFAFATSIASGANYAVTVKTQPGAPTQTCVVTNGASKVGAADVTDVTVTCTTNSYTIGGTITGLNGGTVVLQDNAGDDLSRNADGAFTFATKVNSGAAYAVTVKTQPAGLYCAVTKASGTVAAAAVTDVTVTCTNTVYATAKLASGNKRVAFVWAPSGTAFASNADYAAYCTSKGFTQNQNQSNSAVFTNAGMSNQQAYYCTFACCYLGFGNGQANNLSAFQNFGLPTTDLQVFDRGCGDYNTNFNTGLVTVDRLNVTGATTFTYTPDAYGNHNFGQAKTTTLAHDGVVVCQQN